MPKHDYTGQRFGQIILDKSINGRPGYWLGHCDCGNRVEKRLDNLKRPGDHSCGQCGTSSPRLTDGDIRGKLTAITDQIAGLTQQLTELTARPTKTSSVDSAINSEEGHAIWSYIEDMKNWLKQEIGKRLSALEDESRRLGQQIDQIRSTCQELSVRGHREAVVPHDHEPLLNCHDQYKNVMSDAAYELTEKDAVLDLASAALSNGQSGRKPVFANLPAIGQSAPMTSEVEEEAGSSLPFTHVFPPGHFLHRRFRCRQTDDGYELESNLDGKKECLGFFDTTDQLQEAIQDHLYECGYVTEVVDALFACRSGCTGEDSNVKT